MSAPSLASIPEAGLRSLGQVPFLQALLGRRSRRFPLGATIARGPLAYSSPNPPVPLSEAEELIVLLAAGGNTGWHYAITYGDRANVGNYSGGAGGRTSISGAGFQVSDLFFTNDDGVFFLSTRDSGALVEPGAPLEEVLEAHRRRIVRISDRRLHIPERAPWLELHNQWVVNKPGTTLVIPVADLAQHVLNVLWYFLENGYGIYDDVSEQPIEGLEAYADLIDLEHPRPLSFVELHSAAQASVELGTAAYAGALTLGALGLGGWAFDGIDFFGLLGASGEADYPGLGFAHQTDPRWATPQVTGLPGVFEALTAPNHADLRAALDALVARKYGPGGPFHADTPGPWRESAGVRRAALAVEERKLEAVALIAQHIYDVHGRFPATVPAVFVRQYLQAHHIELGFYDEHFGPGAYLETHARHFERWH
jgi:hypothetical protein